MASKRNKQQQRAPPLLTRVTLFRRSQHSYLLFLPLAETATHLMCHLVLPLHLLLLQHVLVLPLLEGVPLVLPYPIHVVLALDGYGAEHRSVCRCVCIIGGADELFVLLLAAHTITLRLAGGWGDAPPDTP